MTNQIYSNNLRIHAFKNKILSNVNTITETVEPFIAISIKLNFVFEEDLTITAESLHLANAMRVMHFKIEFLSADFPKIRNPSYTFKGDESLTVLYKDLCEKVCIHNVGPDQFFDCRVWISTDPFM